MIGRHKRCGTPIFRTLLSNKEKCLHLFCAGVFLVLIWDTQNINQCKTDLELTEVSHPLPKLGAFLRTPVAVGHNCSIEATRRWNGPRQKCPSSIRRWTHWQRRIGSKWVSRWGPIWQQIQAWLKVEIHFGSIRAQIWRSKHCGNYKVQRWYTHGLGNSHEMTFFPDCKSATNCYVTSDEEFFGKGRMDEFDAVVIKPGHLRADKVK